MTVLVVGRQGKMTRGNIAIELQHHAQAATISGARAHGGNRAALQGQRRDIGIELAVVEVDDQPRRIIQGKHIGLRSGGQIEHQPRMIGRRPQAHALDGRCLQRCTTHQEQRAPGGQPACPGNQ